MGLVVGGGVASKFGDRVGSGFGAKVGACTGVGASDGIGVGSGCVQAASTNPPIATRKGHSSLQKGLPRCAREPSLWLVRVDLDSSINKQELPIPVSIAGE